jgi:hypothetical protein
MAPVPCACSLPPHLSLEARLICLAGPGVTEKHTDLEICRRFEGRGRRWTRTGANRLPKLRLQELDRAA